MRTLIPHDHYGRIAERFDNGESTTKIAAEYGVTRHRVNQVIRAHRGAAVRVTVPREDYSAIAQRVESGERTADVAADYGVSATRVRQITREARYARGIPRPPKQPTLPREEWPKVVDLVLGRGESISATARRFGVSRYQIRKALREASQCLVEVHEATAEESVRIAIMFLRRALADSEHLGTNVESARIWLRGLDG